MDEISFGGGDTHEVLNVDAEYVDKQLQDLVKNQDLARFIL